MNLLLCWYLKVSHNWGGKYAHILSFLLILNINSVSPPLLLSGPRGATSFIWWFFVLFSSHFAFCVTASQKNNFWLTSIHHPIPRFLFYLVQCSKYLITHINTLFIQHHDKRKDYNMSKIFLDDQNLCH